MIHGTGKVSAVIYDGNTVSYTELDFGETDDGDQIYSLEGNKTYYIGLGYTWMDTLEAVCDLSITRKEDAPAIQSASLEFGDMNYTERLDDVYLNGTFTVHYKNDVEKEFTFDGWNKKEAVDEDYGYVYTYKLQRYDIDSSAEEVPGNALAAGDYQILMFCNGNRITMDETYILTVHSVSQLMQLSEGVNDEIYSPVGRYFWYSFTAPVSGRYSLMVDSEDTESEMGQVRIWELIEGRKSKVASTLDADHRKIYELGQGTTYYLGFQGKVFLGYDGDGDESYTNIFSLRLQQMKAVKKASIQWLMKNKMAEYADVFYLQGMLHLTYEDNTTYDVEMRTTEENWDNAGNYYGMNVGRVSVDGSSAARYPAGTYKVRIYMNEFEDSVDLENPEEDSIVQVLPVDQLTLGSLKPGINENVKTSLDYRIAWYTFTPDHDENYVFERNAGPSLYIYAMDGRKLVRQQGTVSSSTGEERFSLTAGVTYYVGLIDGFITGYDEDGEPLFTDTGDINIHTYQSKDPIGDKIDEIDDKLNDVIDNIDEDTEEITEEQKEKINDSVKDIIAIDNKELASKGNAGDILSKSEKLAVMANENVTDTITEVTDKVGEIRVAGAALTAVDTASKGASQDQVLAAKLTVKESDNNYGYTPENSLVLSIKLSVVDTKNQNKVVEENMQPSAPLRVTMPLPDGMDPGKMKLFHVLGDGAKEEVPFSYDEEDMTISFFISSLSDYIFTEGSPASNICTAHVPNENGWITVKEATCKEEGLKKTTCVKCGAPIETVIPVTGNHQAGEWIVIQEATALAAGKKIQKCTVCQKVLSEQEIPALPATLTLSVGAKKTIPLKAKQSYNVKVSNLAKGDSVERFVSSKPKVATVNSNGKITGKAAGTTVITVKLKSGYSVWFKVKVQKTAVKTTALTVIDASTGKKAAKSVKLGRNKKLKLQTTVSPVTSLQKVTYTSSNKKVARAAKNGVITGKKAGTAVITVKSGNKTYKIKVTVK